jgi:hypothetical protein
MVGSGHAGLEFKVMTSKVDRLRRPKQRRSNAAWMSHGPCRGFKTAKRATSTAIGDCGRVRALMHRLVNSDQVSHDVDYSVRQPDPTRPQRCLGSRSDRRLAPLGLRSVKASLKRNYWVVTASSTVTVFRSARATPSWPSQSAETISSAFCSILDGYRRFVIHMEIRDTMKEFEVETIIQQAREQFPGERPRIISDNGQQFAA